MDIELYMAQKYLPNLQPRQHYRHPFIRSINEYSFQEFFRLVRQNKHRQAYNMGKNLKKMGHRNAEIQKFCKYIEMNWIKKDHDGTQISQSEYQQTQSDEDSTMSQENKKEKEKYRMKNNNKATFKIKKQTVSIQASKKFNNKSLLNTKLSNKQNLTKTKTKAIREIKFQKQNKQIYNLQQISKQKKIASMPKMHLVNIPSLNCETNISGLRITKFFKNKLNRI